LKQVIQSLKTGQVEVAEVPRPQVKRGHLLVRTTRSLISAGTERMLVDFGKAGWTEKARQQPDKVRMVLDKIKTDGLIPTIEAVRNKLDQPLPMGYCNVGVVAEVGPGVTGFEVGDRVASNGGHAEVVRVPVNLSAKVPASVSDDEAVFTVIGAIALQGIRLVQPALGEAIAVTGLGLVGLMTVQLLRAHGCHVLGIDFDRSRLELARQFGAEVVDIAGGEDPVGAAYAFSRGRGMDAAIVTASTKTSQPIHQAAVMCRKRGRIVLVGVTGLELKRSDFYEKELSFQVSCSYGPGRYDYNYEEKGCDYPIGFVRWTEQRNFEAVLDMMAAGKLDVNPLITHRLRFEEAEKAYELITQNKEPYLGIILDYRKEELPGDKRGQTQTDLQITQKYESTVTLKQKHQISDISHEQPVIGLIGAGNFTGQILLPALAKIGARLKTIASSGGKTGTHLGKKFGFEESTTEAERIFSDQEINTVFITTRHNSHARLVIEAIKGGKHVFVEKPLCLNEQELKEIVKTYSSQITNNNSQIDNTGIPLLMVGFNRRFAPHIVKIKELLEPVREPKSMIMTVNAGYIPLEHWTQDPEAGGGRIIGEACHFIDLLRFLAGSEIVSSKIVRLQSGVKDTASIQLAFGDGSIGTIHYFANGNKGFPKERLEVFCGGKILQMDNFKMLRGWGWKGFKKMKLWRQDKGHGAGERTSASAANNAMPPGIPSRHASKLLN